MIEREIAEFGRRMGMPSFALAADGLAALDVEGLGRLYLERGPDDAPERELLVYVALPVPDYDAGAPRRVLEACHYRHAHPLPLAGGLHKGNIVLITRLPESRATTADIEKAVLFLGAIRDQIGAAQEGRP